MRQKRVYLAWCACHFALIVAISANGLYSLVVNDLTVIPVHRDKDGVTETVWAMARRQPIVSLFREALVTYLHYAGIEGAYGFFAPNVPESYTLGLQFESADGRVEEDWPAAESRAGAMRLGSLLDKIGRGSEQFQRVFIKMLTRNAWNDHQEAISAKAILAKVKSPVPRDKGAGMKSTYEIVRVYSFSRAPDSN